MQNQNPHHWIVDQAALQLAVVIPVLNEQDNVEPLLSRLSIALAEIEWEAIFVDDGSSDGTIETVEAIARDDRRVRLIRRIGRRGLSSAVMEGFLSSIAPVVAVIDGDMQHDERILAQLYGSVATDMADIAVGSRYVEGGSIGAWSNERAFISKFATKLAAPLLKTHLTDPMSGFFAIKRSVAIEAAPNMSAVGYKLLLDIIASSNKKLVVSETPYTFRCRQHGESKLDSLVSFQFIELVLDKIVGRFLPVKLIMFGAVGGLGVVVHLTILAMLGTWSNLNFAGAQSLAVITAMLFNYWLNNIFTYSDRRRKGLAWWTGLLSFSAACSLGAIANVGVGSIVEGSADSWWIAGLAGAAIGSVWNFVATSWLTWRRR